MEPLFGTLCQRYLRLLKQRNAALKQSARWQSLAAWEIELASLGESIAQHRQAYLNELLPFLEKAQKALIPDLPVTICYDRGWNNALSLEEALTKALSTDQRWGYTSVGPHRGELEINTEGFGVAKVLSRGQQKLVISALCLAQAAQLSAKRGKKCLYLIDDLASELDQANRHNLLMQLAAQKHQVFLTGADPQDWEALSS